METPTTFSVVESPWLLLHVADNEKIVRLTTVMPAGTSTVLRVVTRIRNLDSTYAISEALTTVPDTHIEEIIENEIVIGRKICQN